MTNVMQTGVASAERVFELLDTAEQEPDTDEPSSATCGPTGASSSTRCPSATSPTARSSRTCPWTSSQERRSPPSVRPAPARRRSST